MQFEEYKVIIQLALNNEVEARDFYQAVADKTADNNLKQIFSQLASAEQGHFDLLTGFQNSTDIPLKFAETTDYKIADTLERPSLSIDMKPADAIALAIKKEEDAMKIYQSMADSALAQDTKGVFAELAKMEQGHKTSLEDMYNNMAFPEVW